MVSKSNWNERIYIKINFKTRKGTSPLTWAERTREKIRLVHMAVWSRMSTLEQTTFLFQSYGPCD